VYRKKKESNRLEGSKKREEKETSMELRRREREREEGRV
jgi:hypothetical protein